MNWLTTDTNLSPGCGGWDFWYSSSWNIGNTESQCRLWMQKHLASFSVCLKFNARNLLWNFLWCSSSTCSSAHHTRARPRCAHIFANSCSTQAGKESQCLVHHPDSPLPWWWTHRYSNSSLILIINFTHCQIAFLFNPTPPLWWGITIPTVEAQKWRVRGFEIPVQSQVTDTR